MFWISDRGCARPQENLLRKGQRENHSGLGNSPMILHLRAVASPGALHGSPGEKPATAGPSQPAFKYTWNGTTEACVLMDLLLHILKWPFMFGGAD